MFIIGITRILNYQNTMNIEKKKEQKNKNLVSSYLQWPKKNKFFSHKS